MLYDMVILTLAIAGVTGAAFFSLKVSRSPIRRIGIVRESPKVLPSESGAPDSPEDASIDVLVGKQAYQAKVIDQKVGYGPNVRRAVFRSGSQPQVSWAHKHYAVYIGHNRFEGWGATTSKTAELQDRVSDLEERLKKLESDSLRKLQEERSEEREERSQYIQ